MRRLMFLAAIIAALVSAASASALSTDELRAREHHQLALVRKARSTIAFFEVHHRLLWTGPLHRRAIAKQAVRSSHHRLDRALHRLATVRAAIDRATLGVPDSFMQAALCVHDGWWHQPHPPFARTGDVPDGIAGGSGEGSWDNISGFGGGLQFLLGTWNRASAASGGRVPSLGSLSEVAAQPPRVQVYAAYVIVSQDGGSWREWPQTARACGLPQ